MSHILKVNALAGAGKTYSAVRHARSLAAAGQAVIFVLPTLSLCGEVEVALRSLTPTVIVDVIHSAVAGSVVQAVLAALSQGPQNGRILVVTWSAFVRLPFFPNRGAWTVFIDEIPQIYSAIEVIAPETHTYLTDHIELRPEGPQYGRVVVKSPSALKKLADPEDAALQVFASTARSLLSPNLSGYASIASYEALLRGNGKKLTLFFLLRPKVLFGFKRVTILGANFHNSLLYKIWSAQGIQFVEDAALAKRLRYKEHANGQLIRIYYATERHWSKRLRDQNDRRMLKAIAASAAVVVGGEPFVWIANKDVMDIGLFHGHPAEPLPQVSHGLNSYSHFDNIVYLSARLPPPDQYRFLGWRGADPEAVRLAVHQEAVYQTVMRCSIRDPDSRSMKKIVVPDRSSAEHLQALLPGSTVQKLDTGMDESAVRKLRGRKRRFDDSSARSRAHRARRNAEISRLAAMMTAEPNEITTIGEDVASSWVRSGHQKRCSGNPLEEKYKKNVAQKSRGSLFPHLKATRPIAVVPEMADDIFIAALKKAHKEKFLQKEDNHLICPAVFDLMLSGTTTRGLANVLYANGVWIDVDAGDMNPKDLAAIFPQLRIVVFNSFSSTKAQPRYRVHIPTTRTVSAAEYGSIVDQFIQVVRDSGFSLAKRDPARPQLKAHGVDMTKRHAASLFYLPCQPGDRSGKIWKDFRGGIRKPLNVDDWLEHAIPVETADYEAEPIQHQSAGRTFEQPPVDQARVDQALQRWNAIGVLPGHGDAELYFLSQELRRARVSFYEAEQMLLAAARAASSPQDRFRQAKAILRAGRRSWST
ncbi:hypothetical protein [Methylobacterium soli]|uniref:Uncharacterized protein n=1 Tax=Methylobacterium soli TaxID=553447 RepID=A0A6L3SQQ3_9HYPH|nr:hypothetical protein [Methylobacterium soli]KAB1072072.1 hypothetical protein F6X53_28540 [Methylobacterium soli]GJE43760.1 hypothetical protein AEGHOMDF_2939 [Methylobacterium soli]